MLASEPLRSELYTEIEELQSSRDTGLGSGRHVPIVPLGAPPPRGPHHDLSDVVGRWAHFDVVAYEDDVLRTLIVSTGFADFERRAGELWNQMVFCHADVVNEPGIEVSIADAATSAIRPIATPVEVTVRDGRLRLRRPPTPTAIGIELADPANESLPRNPVIWRRVDPSWDCARLAAERDALFPPNPTIDW